MKLVVLFSTCAAVAWLCGFVVYWLLRKWGVFDVPNARSSHSETVVRGGGLAVLAAVGAGAVVGGGEGFFGQAGWPLAVAVLLAGAISFLDDLCGVRNSIRFLVHAAAGFLALTALGVWGEMAAAVAPGGEVATGTKALVAIGFAVGWIWIVGYTNAFNFMDGINGLAVGQTVVVGAFGAWICWTAASGGGGDPGGMEPGEVLCVQLGAVLSGSALGFLPHNFPRARMFLGDVGSVPLGLLHAVFVIAAFAAIGWKAGVALGAMHLNFLLDTSITLVRRWRRGERIHEAHREHFYQRLNRAGMSHARVTGLEMGLQALFGSCLVGSLFLPGVLFWIGPSLVAIGWLVFFWFCEGRFRVAVERAPSGG